MNYFGKKCLLFAIVGHIPLMSPLALAQDESQVLEEIIVTGSYIQRAQDDEASPITVLLASDLSDQGNVAIGDIFLQIPSISGSEI